MPVTRNSYGSLAVAVVHRARELSEAQSRGEMDAAPTIEALLAGTDVDAALTQLPGVGDGPTRRRLVIEMAIAAGRQVLSIWESAYPEQTGPLRAIQAAEAWAACPCDEHADSAAAAAKQAISESLAAWHRPPKQAAWAGRTAAWVADAPKYGWQAVAALVGACEASSMDQVVAAIDVRDPK